MTKQSKPTEAISDYGIPVFYDNRKGAMLISDTKKFFAGPPNMSEEVWREELINIRREISRDKSFLCGHCKKPIYMAGNYEPSAGHKRLHFHHFFSEDAKCCKFHDGGKRHTEDEIRRMIFNGQQESKEHKELKRIIAESFIPFAGRENVMEEPILRGKDGGWRWPDIFVNLPDKSIVFEVQLTYILLTAVQERNDVHRSNERYVAWIFKDFGDGDGLTLDSERLSRLDIFLANNRNAFVLDDEAAARTQERGKLWVKVYFRDYHISSGRLCASLGTAFVAFDSLTFDQDRKMVYYFDSQTKYDECLAKLEEEKRSAEQEARKQEEVKRKQEEERRLKAELERQRQEELAQKQRLEEIDRKAEAYRSYMKIRDRIFSPNALSADDYNYLIEQFRTDEDTRQNLLRAIFNFTEEHRRDRHCLNVPLYANPIRILTELYPEYSAYGKPSVMLCLKRCWENLAALADRPGMPDLAVDLLFSPALSHINALFLSFIANPGHRLTDEQRTRIQTWLIDYHTRPSDGKNRYTNFYAWMMLLDNKVRTIGSIPLSEAHTLMRGRYKVIRTVMSFAFGFLSGFNTKDYRNLGDVMNEVENHHSDYAALILRHANPQKAGPYLMAKLRNLAETRPQKHDLDTLIRLLFLKT